jgi:hypothetical protein
MPTSSTSALEESPLEVYRFSQSAAKFVTPQSRPREKSPMCDGRDPYRHRCSRKPKSETVEDR